MRVRLAIVGTHPIQYYAPWFARLAREAALEVRVFYLWDSGVVARTDPGFGTAVRWDVPLLEGYGYEFVPNRSRKPGTDRFLGLWNPSLTVRLRDWRPDAVLLTAYNYASLVALLLRKPAVGAPFLLRGDSHRLLPERGLVAALKRAVLRGLFRGIDGALYVGRANREYFLQHGIPDDRLFHAPHAVDIDRFAAARAAAEAEAPAWRASLGIPRAHRVVLFAGKFEDKKRPLDLLRAFAEARLAGVSLLFVGSGPLEARLREAAAGSQHVCFAPFQNQSRMPLVYAAGDVLVLPSFGRSETWGLAVNEAMCMGRAAIVSDHVGCARDLVLPGQTGLVFPAGDVGALAAALRQAMEDPARLREWGAQATRHIQSYSYQAATAGLLAALRRVGGRPA